LDSVGALVDAAASRRPALDGSHDAGEHADQLVPDDLMVCREERRGPPQRPRPGHRHVPALKEGTMKFLLTSAGINNTSIHNALVDLLGKPIAESSALCIPTGSYAMGGPASAWRIITGQANTPLCELGWKSLGVLELTALPSIDEERWLPAVQETDVLLVSGGDVFYLAYWMRQSGLAGRLPSLREAVYVGVSGGSMVTGPAIGEYFEGWKPPTGGDNALGMVDFSLFPHLDNENMPGFAMAGAEEWAAGLPGRGYAIDDQTAIKVTDGSVEVISEGHWKLFTP
jgi:dipeptidase E